MKFDVLAFHRDSRALNRRGWRWLSRLAWGLQIPLCSASVPPGVKIGSGTKVGCRGIGTVIHERAKIGSDCVIAQQVTIGSRSGHHEVPVIEDGYEMGAGARILGPIRLGAGTKVGANAVVIKSTPAGAVVVGVPGRIVS